MPHHTSSSCARITARRTRNQVPGWATELHCGPGSRGASCNFVPVSTRVFLSAPRYAHTNSTFLLTERLLFTELPTCVLLLSRLLSYASWYLLDEVMLIPVTFLASGGACGSLLLHATHDAFMKMKKDALEEYVAEQRQTPPV